MGLIENFKARADGWMNFVTGLGVQGVDKRLATSMGFFTRVSDVELSALFHSDDIAYKIVACLPDEALSRGYTITGVEPEAAGAWATTMEELEFWHTLRRACIFSRLYGGGALIIGADDGQRSPEAQSLPLRLDKLKKVEWIKFADRRRLTRLNMGDGLWRLEPLHYRGQNKPLMVHESRMLFLGGADTDDEVKESLDGWDLSVLQRAYTVLRDNAGAWDSVAVRLQESSYSKTVIKDLAAMLAAGREAAVKARLELLNYTRSAARTVVLDSEEAYTRDVDNLAGIDNVLQMFQGRVSAASGGIPVTKLFGTSARGLNATGEGDADNWYMMVDSHRVNYIQPALEWALETVAMSSEGPFNGTPPEQWSVEWPELEPMSDKDRAEIYEKNANADAIYLTNQVLAPEEVALHRFKRMGYDDSSAFDIDREEREKALEIGKEIAEAALERQLEGGEEDERGTVPGDNPELAEGRVGEAGEG